MVIYLFIVTFREWYCILNFITIGTSMANIYYVFSCLTHAHMKSINAFITYEGDVPIACKYDHWDINIFEMDEIVLLSPVDSPTKFGRVIPSKASQTSHKAEFRN